VKLEGRTALVSASARGLGRAIAQALAAEGARVAVTGRNMAAVEAAARELGGGALALPMDVRKPASVREAFAAVDRHFGKLDILVNNAATADFNRIEQATDEGLAAEVETNFLGPMYCIRAAVPLLRKAGGGDIVNITSESVSFPFPGLTVYAATKGGIEVLSAGLRDELKPEGIRISVLRSGSMQGSDSGLFDHWTEAQRKDAFELWSKSGHLTKVGTPMAPATVAQALIAAVTLPRDAGIDLLEVRGR